MNPTLDNRAINLCSYRYYTPLISILVLTSLAYHYNNHESHGIGNTEYRTSPYASPSFVSLSAIPSMYRKFGFATNQSNCSIQLKLQVSTDKWPVQYCSKFHTCTTITSTSMVHQSSMCFFSAPLDIQGVPKKGK